MRKTIQWYPGHMAKAKRALSANLRLIDVVIELLDARIPISSRNPDIDVLLATKPRVVILNKADLADEAMTKAWIRHIEAQSAVAAIGVSAQSGCGINLIAEACRKGAQAQLSIEAGRGRLARAIRVMVVGIPNVGKSTLINRLVTKASTRVGNRPGVTRGPQWVRIRDDIELLDTPGLLWPKFEDPWVGVKLALTGAISPDILDNDDLAEHAICFLVKRDAKAIANRYSKCFDKLPNPPPLDIGSCDSDVTGTYIDSVLECIAITRGLLIQGGGLDTVRASSILLQDLREGRLGRYTFDDLP